MRRRLFLTGACGAMVGLPLLESLVPRAARAQAQAPRRFIAFFECNGVNMQQFYPSTDYGSLTPESFAGRSLAPLTEYADKLLIPRGIHMTPRGFNRDPSEGDDHAKGMGHKLTAQPLVGSDAYASGISIDQEIANQLNGGRPALALVVGNRGGGVLGHISYTGSEQPVTGENNPWLAYRDLMGLGGLDDEARARLVARRESVLDLVGEEFQRLQSRDLSQSDRQKLDMHFSAIRDLETGMGDDGLVCELDPARAAEIEGIGPDITRDAEFKRVGRMQMDILAMAIACGATRAATLQWGSGAGGPTFTWDGMSHEYNHHKLSHGNTADDCSGGEVEGYEQMLADIDTWFAGEFKYLLDRLSAYEEGEGTVLDNSACVWMNELSDGKGHDYRDLPYVIAGSCGGYLRQGEYVKVTAEPDPLNDVDVPHNMLLTTLLNAVGATAPDGGPVTRFGHPEFGGDGEIEGIKA